MQVFRRLRDEHGYPGGYAQVQRYLRRHRRPTSRNLHPSGTPPRPAPRSRFRSHPRRLPRRPTPRPLPRHHLGLLQRPLRHGAAVRAHRGDPRRHGRRLRVLRRRPQGSLVGQPQDGCHVDPSGARASAPPAVRRPGRHYAFDPHFCMPARGNEKPDAESTVKAVQRRFATPVPRVAGPRRIEHVSFASAARPSASGPCSRSSARSPSRTASPRNAPSAAPLPAHRFDPCVIHPAVAVDKYQTVAF